MQVGDKIPAFKAESSVGLFQSESMLGKKWVLYFYPKDNTPGCTTESNDFNALYDEFIANNCEIVGVSRDSLTSHQRFIDKFDFRFPLISDEDEALCKLFDVLKLKKLYGKEFIGIERSTFVIDEDGRLLHEYRKVKVKEHAQTVLALIKGQDV